MSKQKKYYEYLPIKEVALEKIKDDVNYFCVIIGEKENFIVNGKDLKSYWHEKTIAILLPVEVKQVVTDEDINDYIVCNIIDIDENNKSYPKGFEEGAKWMRDQLNVDKDFIIQKMNELVNDILCKMPLNGLHNAVKWNANSNNIAEYINKWAKENLAEATPQPSEAVNPDSEENHY